jgi:ParB/RepB/Spo0J family partition protein
MRWESVMPKAADRAAQLKARITQDTQQQPADSPSTDDQATRAHFMGATVLAQLTNGRTVQAIPVEQIAPEIRKELRQPRLLPLPEELRSQGEWNVTHQQLFGELLALGRSLQERQIQPIVVYNGTSDIYPTAHYLIAAGHRRWTAAVLVGLATIDAIVIDPPTPEELVDIQYSENEDRADFSDMERAWALARMKQVLHDAPWQMVEQRFRLSEGRRKQLMRLLTFTPAQQQIVAQMRASETQLRPLHAALREGSLTSEQADRVLHQLITRITQQRQEPDTPNEVVTSVTRPTIDSRIVPQLMARVQRAAAPTQPPVRPKWLDPLEASIAQTRKSLQRLPGRAKDLDNSLAMELQGELDQLLSAITNATEALKQRSS